MELDLTWGSFRRRFLPGAIVLFIFLAFSLLAGINEPRIGLLPTLSTFVALSSVFGFFAYRWRSLQQRALAAGFPLSHAPIEHFVRDLLGPKLQLAAWFAATMFVSIGIVVVGALLGRAA